MAVRRSQTPAEDTHCTTRARFLEANASALGNQMDLELYLHFPDRRLPPKLRALPAPPAPRPPVHPGPAPASAFARRPRVDFRARAANDCSRDDD